jgi:hypothetical protein
MPALKSMRFRKMAADPIHPWSPHSNTLQKALFNHSVKKSELKRSLAVIWCKGLHLSKLRTGEGKSIAQA